MDLVEQISDCSDICRHFWIYSPLIFFAIQINVVTVQPYLPIFRIN